MKRVLVALPLICILFSGCTLSQVFGQKQDATPTSAQSAGTILTAPNFLNPYHIFVTDLTTGDLAYINHNTVRGGTSLHGLTFSPDHQTIYATDIGDNQIAVYHVTDQGIQYTGSINVGVEPAHVLFTGDGNNAYVSNFGGTSISVIDVKTQKVIKEIPVPQAPHGMVLSPDGKILYAACVQGAAIAVIDTQTNTLEGTIAMPMGAEPYGVSLNANGDYLYATDDLVGRVFVIDAHQQKLIDSISVGLRPALIITTPDGSKVYETNGSSNSVSVLDISQPANPKVIATISVGNHPHGLAATPDGKYVIVANNISTTLSVIDTKTNTVVATIKGEQYPNDVDIF